MQEYAEEKQSCSRKGAKLAKRKEIKTTVRMPPRNIRTAERPAVPGRQPLLR
jgi:hypothetical protein